MLVTSIQIVSPEVLWKFEVGRWLKNGPAVAGGSQSLVATAARIASIVAWGWDTIEACEPAISVTVAPARSAMWRCASGGITRSSVPTTVQLGSDVHAACPDEVVLALRVISRWLATINQRSASGRSWANELCTVSGIRTASASASGPPGSPRCRRRLSDRGCRMPTRTRPKSERPSPLRRGQRIDEHQTARRLFAIGSNDLRDGDRCGVSA